MVTEMMVRMEVDRAVRFIVGNTAKPSQEMIDFAVALGREPKTQEERDIYLEFMKQTARQTPEVLAKYIDITTVNGLPSFSVDYVKLDAAVIRRALMYSEASRGRRLRQRQEREKQQRHQEEINRIQKMHELNMHAVVSAVAPDLMGQLPPISGPSYNVNPGGNTNVNPDSLNFMLLGGLN